MQTKSGGREIAGACGLVAHARRLVLGLRLLQGRRGGLLVEREQAAADQQGAAGGVERAVERAPLLTRLADQLEARLARRRRAVRLQRGGAADRVVQALGQ